MLIKPNQPAFLFNQVPTQAHKDPVMAGHFLATVAHAVFLPLSLGGPKTSDTFIKFADDTTDNDETAYREEVTDLAVWCQDNSLSVCSILIEACCGAASSSLVSTSPTNYHGPNTSRQY
jgi:hypothetical protein